MKRVQWQDRIEKEQKKERKRVMERVKEEKRELEKSKEKIVEEDQHLKRDSKAHAIIIPSSKTEVIKKSKKKL